MSSTSDNRRDRPIIQTENLEKYYQEGGSFIENLLGRVDEVKAVDGVDLELYEGETLGVVGESGCGKSTLGQSILRLIEPTGGSIYYGGEDLTKASSKRLREVRKDIQYIFQDPFSSLNPRLTIEDIIGEPLDVHDLLEEKSRTERVHELLETVGLNPRHAGRYPHEFSGGQRQRIGIARALAVDPEVIICDEPVSALDVSVQAQILNLLQRLQDEFGMAYIFIAHDLSVVEHISDRVAVMYLGEFVEVGTTEEVFGYPNHPYAEALLAAIPEPDPLWEGEGIYLSGDVPSPLDPPTGCRFHTRCPRVIAPEYNVDQAVWRSLMDLIQRVGELQNPVGLLDIPPDIDFDGDPQELSTEQIERFLRNEFDLPAQVSDQTISALLTQIIEGIEADDEDFIQNAVDQIDSSPCQTDVPRQLQQSPTHRIKCHLFDENYAAEPPAE